MAIFGKKPTPITKTPKLTQVGQAAGALIVAHYAIQWIDAVTDLAVSSAAQWNYNRKAKAALKKAYAEMNDANPEVAEAAQEAQEAVDPNIFTVDQEVVEAVLRRSEEAKKSEQSEAANG